ncbi:N-6 DNA methylase [bacterium]|nr:N-6 DNA methylase [bacterium]
MKLLERDEVDTAFLQEIERWRELLARNIAARNPALTQQEINFAVCRTIDRIIFLRICEDRGIELYGKLMALQNGTQVYNRLFHLFHQADDRYNSGLFHFRQEKGHFSDIDSLTPNLSIDDKALKDIFKNLYYPDGPYEFSVLPADILGQVYEQFLGKVIRLTPGHRAIVEDKPEIRKAGGIYYTPSYIVDYIVNQTVGRLVKGKKPGPRGTVSKLKILDPACGSGSFLLGAYQFLLDWQRDQYVKDDPCKWAKGRTPRLYQGSGDQWRLTTDERKRILLNNIHGVDIDPQAVEVTKLSLLLKVLEGEDEQTIGRQLSLFQERVLPDLQNNIKCGNSLIGPDFYGNRQITMLDEEEMYRINTFDWHAEFPEIMGVGGFDAVIGNPPYLSMENMEPVHRDYYYGKGVDGRKRFATAMHKSNLYSIFWEQVIRLTKLKGFAGLITPYSWLSNSSFINLRKIFLEQTTIRVINLLPLGVFKDVGIKPCTTILQNNLCPDSCPIYVQDLREIGVGEIAMDIETERMLKSIPTGAFRETPNMIFSVEWNEITASLLRKIKTRNTTLGELAVVKRGAIQLPTGDIRAMNLGRGQTPNVFLRERIFGDMDICGIIYTCTICLIR